MLIANKNIIAWTKNFFTVEKFRRFPLQTCTNNNWLKTDADIHETASR
jgi:hypothetical protein